LLPQAVPYLSPPPKAIASGLTLVSEFRLEAEFPERERRLKAELKTLAVLDKAVQAPPVKWMLPALCLILFA
jgi:hypothetical protein